MKNIIKVVFLFNFVSILFTNNIVSVFSESKELNAATNTRTYYPFGKSAGWFAYTQGTNTKWIDEYVSYSNTQWNYHYASVKDSKGRKQCKGNESKYSIGVEIQKRSGTKGYYYQGYKCYSDRW
ncbi:MAG: hypothetical protein ACK5NF_05055 [Bacilli bacterium]